MRSSGKHFDMIIFRQSTNWKILNDIKEYYKYYRRKLRNQIYESIAAGPE